MKLKLLILLISFTVAAKSDENNTVNRTIHTGVSIKYTDIRSVHSIPLFVLPVSIGYPFFHSTPIELDIFSILKTERREHLLKLSVTIPSRITSDSGTGSNYILDADNSNYLRIMLEYNYLLRLLNWNKGALMYGIAPAILYEHKILTYISGQKITRWDLNMGIGPSIVINYQVFPRIELTGQFRGLIFPLYTSFGRYKSVSEGGHVFSSNYRPLTYIPSYGIIMKWKRKDSIISVGYSKSHQISGAKRNIDYYSSVPMLVVKIDRFHEFYISYSIKFK